jgi:riboflavin transporter FmnP
MDSRNYITLALVVVILVLFYKFYAKSFPPKQYNHTRFIARVAIFGAISSILYIVPIFQINLPFLPPFLALHFDEIPAFIAGFAYGPLAGFMVILIKTIIKLPFTSTLCVGELSDLIFSTAFVIPTVLVYKKWRNLKGVAAGFAVGTIIQLIVSIVLNIYMMLPFYMYVIGLPYESILAMCQAVNSNVKDLGWGYGLYCVLPLNAIKDASVIIVTFLVYRSVHILLHFDKKTVNQ